MPESDSIYVVLLKRDEQFVGHAISNAKPTPEELGELITTSNDKPEGGSIAKTVEQSSFRDVIDSFVSIMKTYRNMIPFTIEVSPMVSGIMASREMGHFAQGRGEEVEELRSEKYTVFRVARGYYRTLIKKHEATEAALRGAEHLPEIAIIGLISVYDAYLSKLLRVVFSKHPEMVLTSDREIKYSDLIGYSSIEEARDRIIDREVESVIRNSHHEQFSWMESKFGIPLRSGLDVWASFIELCERRNLLTHTGGLVSNQYIANCAKFGYKENAVVGEKLETDANYFKGAVNIIGEIGFKLGHVLWRKFEQSERAKADARLIDLGVDLISSREYALAEQILDFGYNMKKHSSDERRRMMVVNLANAVRLNGDVNRASNILEKEDWTATGPNFRICVAAAKDDLANVCTLMRQCGATGAVSAEEYREWPIFRGLRRKEEFTTAFFETFGEPLLNEKPLKVVSNGTDRQTDVTGPLN